MIVQHFNHLHLLINGVMQDSEEHPYSKHPHLQHGGGEAIFPLPFVLVFAGYSFILIIDRVMFDSHALFEHGHGDEEKGHGHGHEDHHEQIKKVPSINNRGSHQDNNHHHHLGNYSTDPAAQKLIHDVAASAKIVHNHKN
jgi:hypothetical protein